MVHFERANVIVCEFISIFFLTEQEKKTKMQPLSSVSGSNQPGPRLTMAFSPFSCNSDGEGGNNKNAEERKHNGAARGKSRRGSGPHFAVENSFWLPEGSSLFLA